MNAFFRRSVIGLAVVVPLALGGCANKQSFEVQVDPAVIKLSEAADEISNSYRMLSYAESAKSTPHGAGQTMDYDISEFPADWRELFILDDDFYGELEPFLRGLSRLANYDEPQVLGRRPVVPVTVTLHRAKRPLAEFLVDASYQAGSRAMVTLDPDKNRLLITYAQ